MIYKNVIGHENLYVITENGKLFSMTRGKFVKPKKRTERTSYVLSKKSKVKEYLASALVAEAFIRPRKEGEEVHHKDLDKTNDHFTNLEILTREEHSDIHSRINSSDGELFRERKIIKKNNKGKYSKYNGVSWHKTHKRWQSLYRLNTKTYYLGMFNTELEACIAYNDAVKDIPSFKHKINKIG